MFDNLWYTEKIYMLIKHIKEPYNYKNVHFEVVKKH